MSTTSGDVNLANAINNVANSILIDTAGIVKARTAIAQERAEADFSMMNAQFMSKVANGQIDPQDFPSEWEKFKGQYDDYLSNVTFKPAQESIKAYASKMQASIYFQAAQANNELQAKLAGLDVAHIIDTNNNNPSLGAQAKYEANNKAINTAKENGIGLVASKQLLMQNEVDYQNNMAIEIASSAGSVTGAIDVLNGVEHTPDDSANRTNVDIGNGIIIDLPKSELTPEESADAENGIISSSVVDKAKAYSSSSEYFQRQGQNRNADISDKLSGMSTSARINAKAEFQKRLESNDKQFNANFNAMLKNTDGKSIDIDYMSSIISDSDISKTAKDEAIGKINDHNLYALDRVYSGAINDNITNRSALIRIRQDLTTTGKFSFIKGDDKTENWAGYEGSKSGEDVRWELLHRIDGILSKMDSAAKGSGSDKENTDSPFSIPRQNGVFNNWANGLTITGDVPDANKGEKPASIAEVVEYFNNASQSKNPTEARYGMDMGKKVHEYIPTQAKSSWDSLNNEVFRKDKTGQYIYSPEDRSFVINQFTNAIHNNPTWGNKEVSSFTTNLLATIMDKRQDLRNSHAGLFKQDKDVYIEIIKRAQNKEFQYSINFNPDHSDNSSPRVINQYKDALSYVVNDLKDNYGIDATPVYFEDGQFQMKMNDKDRTTIHVSVNKDNKLVYSYDNKKVISPNPVGGKAVMPETFSKGTDSETVKNIQRAFGFTTGAHK